MRSSTLLCSLLAVACSSVGPASPVRELDLSKSATIAPGAIEEPLGERLDLNLLMPSTDGQSLVAWSASGADKRTTCGISLSGMRAHCTEEAWTTKVESVSASGQLVALSTPTSLVVREVLSSRVVHERPLESRAVAAKLSPDDASLAYIDEAGRGFVVRLSDGEVVMWQPVTAKTSVTSWPLPGVQWMSASLVVFLGEGAPMLVTLDEKKASNAPSTLGPSPSALWRCSDAATFDGKLLVASCDGYVGLFDAFSGYETAEVLPARRHRDIHAVSLEVQGGRALLQLHGSTSSRLESIEPLAAKPLVWSHVAASVAADVRADGRVGWMEQHYMQDGLEFRSFERDLATSEAARPLEGWFLGWSGTNVLTQADSVELRVDGKPVFAHYASWAPAAEVRRRGRFLWVSGGSSMVRISDGDPKPLVFDVFGTVSAPVVKRVAPSRPSPPTATPAPTADSDPEVDEAYEGGIGGGPLVNEFPVRKLP